MNFPQMKFTEFDDFVTKPKSGIVTRDKRCLATDIFPNKIDLVKQKFVSMLLGYLLSVLSVTIARIVSVAT